MVRALSERLQSGHETLALAGAGHAHDHGVHDFQVAGIGGQGQVDIVAVELKCAEPGRRAFGQKDIAFTIGANDISALPQPEQTCQCQPAIFTADVVIHFLPPFEDVVFVFGICHVVIIPKQEN